MVIVVAGVVKAHWPEFGVNPYVTSLAELEIKFQTPTIGGVFVELVGKFIEETATHYVIERPLTLVMSAKGLGLQPWLFTVNDQKPVKIPKEKVIILAATLDEMSKNYLSGTSGIALA